MTESPFATHFPELLDYPESHQIILHLHNAERWPLPAGVRLDLFVETLDGEPRRWAEFILANAKDHGFQFRAEALETATLRVESEYGEDDKSAIVIERE